MSDIARSVRIEDLLTHYEWVQRIAMRLVRDASLADDVAQQTFLAALESPPRDATRVRSWLAKVATNVVRQERRRGTARVLREAAVARETFAEDSASSVARAESQKLVIERVLELEEPFRTTILLRFREGLPPREIAARHGVPVETVRSRVRRGLADLRGRLREAKGDAWRAALVPLLPLAKPGAPNVAPAAGRRVFPRAGHWAAAAAILAAGTASAWHFSRGSPIVPPNRVADRGPAAGAAAADAPRGGRRAAAPATTPTANDGTHARPEVADPTARRAPVPSAPWSTTASFAEPAPAPRTVVFRFRPFPPPAASPGSEDIEVPATVPGTVETRLPLARADGTPIPAFVVTVDDPDLLPWRTRIDAPREDAPPVSPAALGPLVRAAVVRGTVAGAAECEALHAAVIPVGSATSAALDQVAVAADGTFRLRVRPGERHVVAVAARDRRPFRAEVVAGTAEETSLPAVRLAAGGTIRGIVRDVHGAPVTGANVRMTGTYLDEGVHCGTHALTFGADRAEIHTAAATTDAAGRFSFGGLGDGEHTLDVAPPGATAALLERLRWQATPADEERELVVESATFRVTVLRGGAAMPGVRLTTAGRQRTTSVETGALGSATLLVAPGEETELELGRRPETLSVRLRALAPGESVSESIEFPAPPAPATWRVRVTGLPGPPSGFCGVRLVRLDGPKPAPGRARDLALTDGVLVVEGVAPGRYRAHVRPGTPWADARNLCAEDVREVEFSAGGVTETTVEAHPAGRIEVTTRDESGTRVAARVTLKDAAGNRVATALLGYGGIPGAELYDHVAADGPSSLHPALAPGTYTLVLEAGTVHAGPLTVEIRAGEVTKVEATLRP